MRMTTYLRTVSVVLVLLGACVACSKDKKAPHASAAPSGAAAVRSDPLLKTYTPSTEQKQAAKALLAQLSNGHFPLAVITKENARHFLFLAATEADPKHVAAALEAMSRVYTAFRHDQRIYVDDDYARVVLEHLASKNEQVRFYALQAAKSGTSGPKGRPELVQRLIAMGNQVESPAELYEIVDALSRSNRRLGIEKAADVYVKALDSTAAYVLSPALFSLSFDAENVSDRARLEKKVTGLLSNPDPGVRGRAFRVLGHLAAAGSEEDMARLEQGLKDEHPYVRSEAALAIATAGDEAAAGDLIQLLTDEASNVYQIRGFARMNGSKGIVPHRGSPLGQVNEAAATALVRLSKGQFALAKPENGTLEARRAALKKSVPAAKAWLRKAGLAQTQ